MKVLHIALTDGGGAGLGMMNQHLALLKAGVDSKVLVAYKKSSLDSVYEMKPNLSIWSSNKYIYLLEKIARRLGICLTEYDKIHHLIYIIRRKHPVPYSSPITQYDVSGHPLVKEADIINLHFIAGFVDVESFFTKVKKPIVWTMRDENPGLGGFHYEESKKGADTRLLQLDEKFLNIKRKVLKSYPSLHLVSLSKLMYEFCEKVDFLSCHSNQIIYNAINPDTYQIVDKRQARKELSLSEQDIIISFVSTSLGERRKRLREVMEAVKILRERVANKQIKLLCVGNEDIDGTLPNMICLGMITDTKQLCRVYSASDVFVSPSAQESFGKTVIEALFCGTPVVSTPVGIAAEVINEDNGIICKDGLADNIASAIGMVLRRKYNSESIRQASNRLFSPYQIAEQYINLYNNILENEGNTKDNGCYSNI